VSNTCPIFDINAAAIFVAPTSIPIRYESADFAIFSLTSALSSKIYEWVLPDL
jgi:hypothetical protein